MRKHQVEQAAGIGPLTSIFPRVPTSIMPRSFAHCAVLSFHALVLIALTVVARPLPLTHVHPDRSEAVVLIVHRCTPNRMMTHAGERAEGHRRRGRPGDGVPTCAIV